MVRLTTVLWLLPGFWRCLCLMACVSPLWRSSHRQLGSRACAVMLPVTSCSTARMVGDFCLTPPPPLPGGLREPAVAGRGAGVQARWSFCDVVPPRRHAGVCVTYRPDVETGACRM